MTNRALTRRNTTLLAPQLDYILVDGSGSMQGKWWDTLASLDHFMTILNAENIHSHGIVHVFDSINIEMIQRDSTLATWPRFSAEPLSACWGGTPLYDAINLMGRTLRDLDPPKASIVIVTDGRENGSTRTTADQARAILDWCRAKGWQVSFIGADFNNSRQAKLLGSTERNSIGVAQARLADAGKLLAKKRIENIRSGKDINFSKEEQSEFGGYLADQRGDAQ